MSLAAIFASLFSLFRSSRKPKPPAQATLKWSGLATAPSAGSFALQPGTAGKARTEWDVAPTPVPWTCRPLRFAVRLSAPVEAQIEIMLYQFLGGFMITVWCPTITIAAGQSAGEVTFPPDWRIPLGVGLIAWGAYPPALGNTKPVDVFAEVTLAQVP